MTQIAALIELLVRLHVVSKCAYHCTTIKEFQKTVSNMCPFYKYFNGMCADEFIALVTPSTYISPTDPLSNEITPFDC